jgi:predicted ArsR family transcriptional regulator
MSNTRDLVLQNLLERQRCTINDLADAVEINPISVRHHIGRLEDEGLVDSEEERHGVGRPRRVYYLTEKGVEQFPARTVRFTRQLLDQMKSELPEGAVDKLFKGMADDMIASYRQEGIEALSLDERLALVDKWLTNEGFSVQVERDEHQVTIRETACPYYHVGQSHDEVCHIDKALIAEALSVSPERTTCLLDGDNHCTYIIPLTSIPEAVN